MHCYTLGAVAAIALSMLGGNLCKVNSTWLATLAICTLHSTTGSCNTTTCQHMACCPNYGSCLIMLHVMTMPLTLLVLMFLSPKNTMLWVEAVVWNNSKEVACVNTRLRISASECNALHVNTYGSEGRQHCQPATAWSMRACKPGGLAT